VVGLGGCRVAGWGGPGEVWAGVRAAARWRSSEREREPRSTRASVQTPALRREALREGISANTNPTASVEARALLSPGFLIFFFILVRLVVVFGGLG